MTETLLAHLANRLGHGTENLATEALAFVLRHPGVSHAFQQHLRAFAPDLADLTRFRTQVAGEDDLGIRDLVGSAKDNTSPLVVEVKFDAPLTSNQPQTYLSALGKLDCPSLLLFLVPTRRVEAMWTRLRQRCTESGLDLVDVDGRQHLAAYGAVTLAVTTWERLLDQLSAIPPSAETEQVLAEIQQLRGLCERQDREGWVPFERAFLEGEIGRHMLDLDALLTSAVDHLAGQGVIQTGRYKRTSGQSFYGRYFELEGHQALLHVNLSRWGRQAATPLWLRVWGDGDRRVADALSFLANEVPRGLFDDDGRLLILIRLQPGTDRDTCLELTTRTILRVRDALRSLPASDSPDELADPLLDIDERD